MKKIASLVAALCVVLTASQVRADFITLNFATVPGAGVVFNGTPKTFSFTNSTKPAYNGFSFAITSTTTQAGDDFNSPAVGLMGTIAGSFYIDPSSIVTTGGKQTASVTTTGGVYTINDGAGHSFTADLDFTSIYTEKNGGLIDSGAVINLTNFAYNGINTDLVKLRDYMVGSLNTSFQFKFASGPGGTLVPVDLTYLTTNGNVTQTSYSGSLTAAAPLPGGLALAASGCLLMAGAGFIRRLRGGKPPIAMA